MGGEEFSKNIWFEVGVGDGVKLGTDLWCGESTSIDFSEGVWDGFQ